jgi:hypothetical protein
MGEERVVKAEVETGRAQRIHYPVNPRLQRMRFFSNLLDQCITLPGGMRIGIDPIVGLVPAIGDLASTAMSLYLVYEAARLGLPKRILLRMLVNVAFEMLMGTFPVLGDLFDAVWKANMRNLRLVELHYSPSQVERSKGKIIGWLLGVFLLFVLGYLVIVISMLKAILSVFGF